MFRIIRANIVKLPFKVDVIVNSADTEPNYNFGVDRAIHLAAGEKLLVARKNIGKIEVGDVKSTDSFDLKDKAKKIFHAVTPIWSEDKINVGKIDILRRCYKTSFKLALEEGYHSVACPILASGNNGLEVKKAVQIAIEESLYFLFNCNDSFDIYLVIFDKEIVDICSRILSVKSYIEDKEVKEFKATEKDAGVDQFRAKQSLRSHVELKLKSRNFIETLNCFIKKFCHPSYQEREFNLNNPDDLKDILSFGNISDRIFYSIVEKDKNSKLVDINKEYHPSRNIAIRFVFALRLTIEDAMELLKSAGYILNVEDNFDRRVMDLLDRKIYDIFKVESKLPELKNRKTNN